MLEQRVQVEVARLFSVWPYYCSEMVYVNLLMEEHSHMAMQPAAYSPTFCLTNSSNDIDISQFEYFEQCRENHCGSGC